MVGDGSLWVMMVSDGGWWLVLVHWPTIVVRVQLASSTAILHGNLQTLQRVITLRVSIWFHIDSKRTHLVDTLNTYFHWCESSTGSWILLDLMGILLKLIRNKDIRELLRIWRSKPFILIGRLGLLPVPACSGSFSTRVSWTRFRISGSYCLLLNSEGSIHGIKTPPQAACGINFTDQLWLSQFFPQNHDQTTSIAKVLPRGWGVLRFSLSSSW